MSDSQPTEHDITRHAMDDDAALARLIRLERSRSRSSIWRFVSKLAAATLAVVVVFYAARGAADGMDVRVPEQIWPLLSFLGASSVTALVGVTVARLPRRRGPATDNRSEGSDQASDGAP